VSPSPSAQNLPGRALRLAPGLGSPVRTPGWRKMGGVGLGGFLSRSSGWPRETTCWSGDHVLPVREPGGGRERVSKAGRASPGPRAPSGPSPVALAGRPSPSLRGPPPLPLGARALERVLGSGERSLGGLSGGQRRRARPRGRCSWLVAARALRPRPRRRLPPCPLRGLQTGTQLTPQPRGSPLLPSASPGADRAASSAAPRAARPAAASAAQRPAPRSPPPPAEPTGGASPAVTQAAVPGNFLHCRDHPAPRAGGQSCGRPLGTWFQTGKEILPPPCHQATPASEPPTWRALPRLVPPPLPIPNNVPKTRGCCARSICCDTGTAAPPLGKLERSSYH
jgi:hypothetical protein